jgi:hypothetical protein
MITPIAMMDLSSVAPDFMRAVTSIHRSLTMVAQVMCFGGFSWLIVQALREQHTKRIWESMSTLMLVVLMISNTVNIGLWIEGLVVAVEADAGVNTSAFSAYLDVVKSKLGIDMTALKAAVPGEASVNVADNPPATQQTANDQQGNWINNTGKAVTDTWNALMHPAEATQSAIFGVFLYVLSLISAGIWFVMRLIQAVLFYCSVACAPLFLGTLLIRGWENVAKAFIASFIAICLWGFVFVLSDMALRGMLDQALASASPVSIFWMIAMGLWIVFSYTVGPAVISTMLVRGSTGTSELLGRAGSAAVNTVRTVTRL